MTEKTKPSQLLATLVLPERELNKFSFSKLAKPSAVKEWLDSLRATQVMNTGNQLYQAIPEVARLDTEAQNRLEILECFRPSIQYNIMGLEKKFLRQPLIMPEAAQKAATLAQSLQKHMVDGYVATVIQIAETGRANRSTFDLLSKAIHRAMVGIGLIFFRNYQIYAQPPSQLWSTLHILYRVADYYELTGYFVNDPFFNAAQATTIEAAYCRALMLEVAKTNQLSQYDIQAAYSAFENWCQAIRPLPELSDDSDNFFAVDLSSDEGPVYKSKLKNRDQGTFIELNFQSLLSQISKQSAESEVVLGSSSGVKVPEDFSSKLLDHLIDAWSNIAHRKYDRRALASVADVCVGLSDCHYFICNEQDFDYFLQSAGVEEPKRLSSFAQDLSSASMLPSVQSTFTDIYRVSIQNVSTGGFCLFWQGDVSNKISAGEIIGIKEVGKRIWSIGVIRWVRQLKNSSRLGIELLSDKIKPYGVAQNFEAGGYSDYMRAMLLPPSKIGQDRPMLLTAAAPLQETDKVRIVDGDKIWRAKLERRLMSTKNIQLFSFKNIESVTDQASTKKADTKSFDSSWE